MDWTKRGRDVLSDPFLVKNTCSQLALLSDEAYAAGLRKIEAVIARGETIVFESDVAIQLLTGRKRGEHEDYFL